MAAFLQRDLSKNGFEADMALDVEREVKVEENGAMGFDSGLRRSSRLKKSSDISAGLEPVSKSKLRKRKQRE